MNTSAWRGEGFLRRARIEEALQTFVSIKTEEQRASTYREQVELLDRKLARLILRESPSSVLRKERERA